MSDTPDQEIDLTPEQCSRIDTAYAEVSSIDFYRVLGVAPGSDDKTIRRGYGERVREFHPDRYFRKRLGPYRAKLETIFTRVETAYETLRSREKRSAYDAANGIVATKPAPVATDPRRDQALAALKNQLEGRHAQGRQLAAAGARAIALGDAAGALESYRKALALAPSDSAIRAAHDATKREVDGRAAVASARQAEREEQAGHWAEAVHTWERVLQARPDDANAKQRLESARLRAAGVAGTKRS